MDPRTDLKRGTRVMFLHKGKLTGGKVVWRHLDPNRKPGIGRVSYDILFHPAFRNIRIRAKELEIVRDQ